VLCVGPTGTGKTLAIADKLTKSMPKDFIPEFITFSAKTSANQTQDLIDGKLDRRSDSHTHIIKHIFRGVAMICGCCQLGRSQGGQSHRYSVFFH